MEKMNRGITQQQLDSSKEKNINAVMQSVNHKQSRTIISMFKLTPRYVAAFVLLLVAVLTITFINLGDDVNPNNNSSNELVLNTSTTESLVELSYISASLMSNTYTVSANTLVTLAATGNGTMIETDIEELNTYFDMLKVFLNEEPFGDSVLVEELVDGDFENKISFASEGKNFEFYINIEEQNIEGELYIEDLMYVVEGKQVIEENESKLQLKAVNGNDYVEVEYKVSSEDLESTQKYSVETSFNGVLTQKDIKVSIEEDSLKVTIEDLTSVYNLKKNTEDDLGKYKLDYTIDGEKGGASIYEDVDAENNLVYRYEIREGNLTDTILVPMQTETPEAQGTSSDAEEAAQKFTT